MHNHYKSLITIENGQEEAKEFLKHIPHTINEEKNNEITKEVRKSELMAAIWSFHLDKAPGPNGFSISLYRSYWKLIKKILAKDDRICF